MSSHPEPTSDLIKALYKYGACDISDALLKLNVPGAGFLPDLMPYCVPSTEDANNLHQKVVAPASTVLFVPKNNNASDFPPSNIPAGSHWVDLTEPGTIVVQSQPENQNNAVLGGIMALRMKRLGALGVVVHGRIRDVDELGETDLMVCRLRSPIRFQQDIAKFPKA